MNDNIRVVSEEEVNTFLAKLKYAINSGCDPAFQESKESEKNVDPRFTNKYTINNLFPNEAITVVLRRELSLLCIEEYMHCMSDSRFLNKSEFYVFARKYNGRYVYIKVRVELLNEIGNYVFVISFHYSRYVITITDFPYL